MKIFQIISFFVVFLLSGSHACAQYFVSTAKSAAEFIGFPCFIKLKTGEEIHGMSGTIIWGKYHIKTDKGTKLKIKPGEIRTISFNVSKSRTYVWALTKESQNILSNNKGLAKKDTFIFENIDGWGLLQWLNPGFSGKLKVYAYEVEDTNVTKDEAEKNEGSMKYLIVRGNAAPVIVEHADYRKTLRTVFSDCPKMMAGLFDEQMRWDDIGRHVFIYDQSCK